MGCGGTTPPLTRVIGFEPWVEKILLGAPPQEWAMHCGSGLVGGWKPKKKKERSVGKYG